MVTKNLYKFTYWCSVNNTETILYVSGNNIIDAITAFHYCAGSHINPIEIRFIHENFVNSDDQSI